MEQVARQTSQIRRQNQTVAEQHRVQNGGRHDLRCEAGQRVGGTFACTTKNKIGRRKKKKI